MNNCSTTFPTSLCKLRHFERVWERLQETHCKRHAIPYSLLVLGQSGVGKSALARAYCESHPVVPTPSKLIMPVLYVALTDTTTPKALVEQLLHALNVTAFNRSTTLLQLQDRLLHLLSMHQVELVIIDEVQECLPRAHGPARQKIIKLLTWLIDHSQIPFALFGTPIAENLFRFGADNEEYKTEEQFSRRCYAPIRLTAIPPMSQSWLAAANYFLDKRDHSPFDIKYQSHKGLLNRLYLATSGKFGLLEKFLLHLPSDINMFDEQQLPILAKVYATTISDKNLNPFDDVVFNDIELESHIQRFKQEFK